MSAIEIRKVLVLSTLHITPETCNNYSDFPFSARGLYATYFVVPEDADWGAIPTDLMAVLEFAKEHGCHEVKFDADGYTIDLPSYEWP